jgi:hypothetical protein
VIDGIEPQINLDMHLIHLTVPVIQVDTAAVTGQVTLREGREDNNSCKTLDHDIFIPQPVYIMHNKLP